MIEFHIYATSLKSGSKEIPKYAVFNSPEKGYQFSDLPGYGIHSEIQFLKLGVSLFFFKKGQRTGTNSVELKVSKTILV